MSHKKRLEEQFSSSTKRKRLTDKIDIEDYNELENIDYSERVDSQLDRLLQDVNQGRANGSSHKKKGLFKDMEDLDGPQYEGKKVSRKDLYNDDLDESIDSDLASGMEEEEEEAAPKLKASKKVTAKGSKQANGKNGLGTKKVKISDINVDDILQDLDRQDEEVFKDAQKDTKELEKAHNVQNQQKLWDGLLEGRVIMQNSFKFANQIPSYPAFNYYKKDNAAINTAAAEIQVELLDMMDLMGSISAENLKKSGMKKSSGDASTSTKERVKEAQQYLTQHKISKDTFLQDFEFDADAIWNDLDSQFLSVHSMLEETINTFSQRFNLMNTSSIKSKFMNVFQTPMQQAQKMMDDYPRLLKRTQLKDKDFKVMGAFEGQNEQEYDEEIYNDSEFYNHIYKEFITNAQSQSSLIDGELAVGNTQAYLKQKLLRSKIAKPNVDRRASKARKLRYEVHPKLMNFMTPVENSKLIPGRDDLIKNLFGLQNNLSRNELLEMQAPAPVKSSGKKVKNVKKAGKSLPANEDEEENIQLI